MEEAPFAPANGFEEVLVVKLKSPPNPVPPVCGGGWKEDMLCCCCCGAVGVLARLLRWLLLGLRACAILH